MPRPAEIGIHIGSLPPGRTASVLDVEGVGLGHVTIHRDEPEPPEGRGTARTGVTVLLLADDAYRRPLAAGGAVLNGAGEFTGVMSAAEWGLVQTPVYLTSTMQLGRVYDAACDLALDEDAHVAEDVVIPAVAECDDSFLNDCRRMQVTTEDVRAAHRAALASRGLGAPQTGSVGAGTGMSCLGFKGGVGTSSRVLPDGHTVAVLLLTNFGQRDRLTVAGVPVGRLLPGPEQATTPPAGSCIGVVVTDAPVGGAACSRLARRVGLGLARTGSTAHHGSGEIFLAASTTWRGHVDGRVAAVDGAEEIAGPALDPYFEAVVDCAEEAVLDSLLMSPTTVGRSGNTSEGLDPGALRGLLS